MQATAKKQVLAAISAWSRSYRSGDVDAVMAHFAPRSTSLSFGTGADEVARGPRALRRQLARDFAQVDAVSMTVRVKTVDGTGSVAWFAGDCTMRASAGRRRFVMPGRITGVMVRCGGKWLMEQMHYSMPYTPQAKGSSWA